MNNIKQQKKVAFSPLSVEIFFYFTTLIIYMIILQLKNLL